MNILYELQSKKLGLLELISLGFDLYLKKNRIFLSTILIHLPFTIILIGFATSLNYSQNSFLWFLYYIFYFFYIFVIVPIYGSTLSILTETCVLQEKIQPKAIAKRIFSRILSISGLWMKFSIIMSLRSLLLIIPGIIYGVNNGFCLTSFILRDQRGKAAFQYSQSLVKGNWWKAFFFSLLTYLISFGLQGIFRKILSSAIANSPILVAVLSTVLTQVIALGVSIAAVLLFLNLEFQKQ
ncbi:hypothetical protein [Scytonema sp. NUACC26]|uniref:hypothetical protein n=1 Tax=Scytonema sp. NUACC26 TaxID=3140176 RepID=UPI0034DC9BBB